ncbi:MAG: type pilus assembly PilZ [Mycobacterium sp.]|nr:type pilus assembly PilZ [Mycobacterium sp.]
MPPVNSLVRVVLADDEERPSRVESDDDGLLTVAAPWHAATIAPEAGEPLAIRWATVRGVCEVAASLVAVEWEQKVPLWRVQVTGEVRIVQRRRFVRADASAPVTVAPVPTDPDAERIEPVMATLTNLSEGGARCRVDNITALEKAGLVQDGGIELRLSLGAAIVHVVGEVVRITPDVPWSPKDCAEIVTAFEAPDQAADLIRRFVLHQQVLARRAARD